MYIADEEKLNAGEEWKPGQGKLSGKHHGLKERKCPECGSGDVRRSQMRGLWERGVLKMVGMKAYRCERCDRRYYEFKGIELKGDKLQG